MCKTIGKTLLNPASLGSAFSYELSGNIIKGRLFGLIPVKSIHLADVHYLRLATCDELTPTYLLFNWPQFLPHHRSIRPVYILQTKTRHRIFLRLGDGAHFRLRQAIGQKREQQQRMAA